MEMNSNQIEGIVRQILAQMGTSVASSAPAAGMAKVAMLTGPKTIEIKEYPLPTTLGDDEILVKVVEIDKQGRINLSRKEALADIAAKKNN